MSKCGKEKRYFGIRMEKRNDDTWYCTWAFKMSEKAAKSEGYDNTVISGAVRMDHEYPGCPYCGGNGWVVCGRCGKLTCCSGNESDFTCGWCKNKGVPRISESFSLFGGGY